MLFEIDVVERDRDGKYELASGKEEERREESFVAVVVGGSGMASFLKVGSTAARTSQVGSLSAGSTAAGTSSAGSTAAGTWSATSSAVGSTAVVTSSAGFSSAGFSEDVGWLAEKSHPGMIWLPTSGEWQNSGLVDATEFMEELEAEELSDSEKLDE